MTKVYLTFTDFVYVRLTAVIWVKNGLSSISNLSKDSGDLLREIYAQTEIDKPIILDFKGVTDIIDHSWDSFFLEIEKTKRAVVFLNSSPIDAQISNSHKEFCSKSSYSLIHGCIHIANDHGFIVNQDLLESIKSKLLENISKFINSSFCLHEHNEMKLLPSTPFYANGEYSATRIIADSNSFIWTCIFLADFIENIIEIQTIGSDKKFPIMLLSVSLRSSPFAGAISLILNYPLQTIEYLGPKRNTTYPNSNVKGGQFEYLYVGDFSFAGTEIRITKIYASLTNSKLVHAFVLGSLMPSEAFTDFQLHALTDLRKINTTAKYLLFKDEQ